MDAFYGMGGGSFGLQIGAEMQELMLIVLTDGDANFWPQRWIEKRWRIDTVARARWGARRREEARAAMRVLGLDAGDTAFFGFPDLGLTDLLMHADPKVPAALRAFITQVSSQRVAAAE